MLVILILDVGTKNVKQPSVEGKPFGKHMHGELTSDYFNQYSAIEAFLYLALHTHLVDIIYTVNCDANTCLA